MQPIPQVILSSNNTPYSHTIQKLFVIFSLDFYRVCVYVCVGGGGDKVGGYNGGGLKRGI